jgi:putative toxin-antitoxin system antitoxin component (TIGR02293 family)
LQGLPNAALAHFWGSLTDLRDDPFLEAALGMSRRTILRRSAEPAGRLSRGQGNRLWQVAAILAKSIELLGTQAAAERWLSRPALGLNGHPPLELLQTPPGKNLVDDLLVQLEYGVYI